MPVLAPLRAGRSRRALPPALLGLVAALAVAGGALAAPLAFDTPEGWVPEPPASRFRTAQFRLPAPATATAQPRCVVYHFGNTDAGGVEANLARWRSQMRPGDGDPPPRVERRKVGSLEIVVLDQQGTYTPGRFARGDRSPRPGWRMVAAIVPTSEGSYFVQVLGPKDAVAAQRAAIDRFLASLRLSPR